MTQYFDDKDLKYFILWSSSSILYEEIFTEMSYMFTAS